MRVCDIFLNLEIGLEISSNLYGGIYSYDLSDFILGIGGNVE